ncbi:MAG: ABC transporter ATP-binding protein [Acidobacteria bacterium]|nr:ABC transporter ATP-binding protein [Acidobacteriota bacterium]
MTPAAGRGWAIEMEDARFSYRGGPEIVRIGGLRVEAGEHVFIFGPSGSGKTTLLGLLAGVLRATSGRVSILGQDLTAMKPSGRDAFRASHIGYIFQLFNLIPYLSVRDNITLPCRLNAERRRRLNGTPMEEAAGRIATHLGMGSLLGENVSRLSVGQQQRVAAARSLMGTPELVIADEPTSSLDFDHRERFVELLFQECREANSTLIFVSHDQSLMPMFHRTVSLTEINEAM